ncbi:Gluconolactonase [Anaerohalosphaera lusitana]|uniref:Gluconolactonase n=1 Tax=Anaerohalosphaera lusitana TaxID=1936003 RepID=A0A1U9NJL6_9BACT|nr:DUF5050 domain-containing protein [Anaerohalosphaera lusitana]AQT67770.1 Gluconolactonase [Anaerohalosphaera lusitana]
MRKINRHILSIAVLLFLSILTVSPAGHIPTGIHFDVPLETVLNDWGWEIVYRGDYGERLPFDDVFGDVTRDTIMLAGIRDGSQTIDVLAAGPTDEVLEYTPKDVTHEANGVLWFCNAYSMGFAGPGDVIKQLMVDTSDDRDRDRLTWNTNGFSVPDEDYTIPDELTHGGQSGRNINLTYSTEWDRLVLEYVGDVGNPVALVIQGPETIVKGASAQFKAVAVYDTGIKRPLNSSMTWAVSDDSLATIDSRGVLTASDVSSPQKVTIHLEYIKNGVTCEGSFVLTITTVEKKLYFSNEYACWRADPDGSNLEPLPVGQGNVFDIAFDYENQRMYWGSLHRYANELKSANLDGSDYVAIGKAYVRGVAVYPGAGKVYWTDSASDTIERANLDGSNKEVLVSSGLAMPSGLELDVSEGKMYWVDTGNNHVRCANLDGTQDEILVRSLDNPIDLKLDLTNRKMYWVDHGSGKLQRANLDGTRVEDVVTGLAYPGGIALDLKDDKIYWTDFSYGHVARSDLDGSNIEIIAEDLDHLFAINISAQYNSPSKLLGLEIFGPAEVLGTEPEQYQAIAHYQNKSLIATDLVTWSVTTQEICSIEDGKLLVDRISRPAEATIYAEYSDGGRVVDTSKIVTCVPMLTTYYVEAAQGNDSNIGTDPDYPLATIQKAIELAEDGDTVLVNPGTYQGEVDFMGKAVTVAGVPGPDGAPVIDGLDDFAVSFYNAEGPDTVFKNFVIENSYIAVFLAGSSPTISNLTIVNNRYGIEAYADAQPAVSNCIFWNNELDDIFQCTATYSCIERGYEGQGNIADEPLFADFEQGDYRLHSEMGRYWPEIDKWVLDDVTSPCINTGDPALYPAEEPSPNGGRINMGVYGGTTQASRGPWAIKGDINQDAKVDMADLAIFANNWLTAMPWTQQTD